MQFKAEAKFVFAVSLAKVRLVENEGSSELLGIFLLKNTWKLKERLPGLDR